MIPKNKVLALFDARFDYASARIVLADALAKAGVNPGKDGLDPEDVRRLGAAIVAMGIGRVEALLAGLDDLTGNGSARKPAAAPAAVPEAAPKAAPEAAPAPDAETAAAPAPEAARETDEDVEPDTADQGEEPAEQAAENGEAPNAKGRPGKFKRR